MKRVERRERLPHTHVWRLSRVSRLQYSLLLGAWGLKSMQGSQTRSNRAGNKSLKSIWCRKSVGIQSTWEIRESAGDPDATFPGTRTPVVIVPAWGSAASSQLLGKAPPLCWDPEVGSVGCTYQWPWGALFSGEALDTDSDSDWTV